MPATEPTTTPVLPANVRLATEADEGALFDCLMALNEDNGYGLPVSEQRVMEQMRLGTRRQGGIIGIVTSESGRIEGTVGIFISQPWYTDTYILEERWLFVRPDSRNGHIHTDLFNFVKWARATMEENTKTPWIAAISVTSMKRLPAKMRLWSRHARHVGAIFFIGHSGGD